MVRYFLIWLAVTAAFLAIDSVWLGYVARGFYQRHIGALLREDFNLGVAAAFYALYAAGIVFLVVLRAPGAGQALLMGAVLGFCAYGTYDLTNLATLKGWSVTASMVDLAWGTVLTAVAAWVGYLAMSRLG